MSELELIQKRSIKNIGRISIFAHKSGARVVSVDTYDNNLVFSLCFNTPAFDDTGIPHILEHCVLCGSDSYPFKDPFNILEQNTLHSYLNAMTYPHKTLYPVASADEDSLMLMAGIYCDAVFHPLVYKNKGIFLQEGGFFDGQKILGSVYGEMSGFYAIPENNTEQRLKKAFTPFLSAGTPEDIPNANYYALLDYHKKYYTPSNCTAYIYGSCDKEKYLKLLSDTFNGAENCECSVPPQYDVPNKIFSDTGKSMALIPLCRVSNFYAAHNGNIACRALKSHGINAEYNTDEDTAYIKIIGDIEKILQKYRGKINSFDTTAPYFYIKNGDFGFKPRGLYYNIQLMQAEFDPESLDFERIFSDIDNSGRYTDIIEDIFSRKIEYINTSVPTKKAYPVTDPSPLYTYQAAKDVKSEITAHLPDISCESIIFDGKTAFTDNKNKDIVNLTLAFTLDMPQAMLDRAASLLKMRHTALSLDEREFADIGRPAFLIHLGFFANKIRESAEEINKIINADTPLKLPSFSRELLTRLFALSAVEESSYILSRVLNGTETQDIADIQKKVFTRKNMYCAICTDKSNFNAVKSLIAALGLYPDNPCEKSVFHPQGLEKTVLTESTVNHISLAFTADTGYAEKYAIAVYLQNTYLWENIRCKGAYGCDCGVTPNGSIYMTSYKDIAFESSIDTMRGAFSYIQGHYIDLHKVKLMCLNALLRPKTPKKANIYALERLFGKKDITADILFLTKENIKNAAQNTNFVSFYAFKAKN